MRRLEARADTAIPPHFSTWLTLTCHAAVTSVGKVNRSCLWGWKDISFHILGVTCTNKNLSNIFAGLPLTLNTHTIPWPIQFHEFGKELLMTNCLLSPHFISISLWILKCIPVRNNIDMLEMTCHFLKSIILMLQGMWLQFSPIFNSFITLNARCFLLQCWCFFSLGPFRAGNFKSSFLQLMILMLLGNNFFFPNLHSGSESRLLPCNLIANKKDHINSLPCWWHSGTVLPTFTRESDFYLNLILYLFLKFFPKCDAARIAQREMQK